MTLTLTYLLGHNISCWICALQNTTVFHAYLYFSWGVAEAKCILVTAVCVPVCVSVCLSLSAFLVVHYCADLQWVHGFRCYDNTTPNAKCQRAIVGLLAVCLVSATVKIATITYRARQSGQPAYLCSELEDYRPTRNSRSASAPLLNRPHVNNVFSSRAFSVSAPTASVTRCKLGHVHLKLMPLSETD